MIDGLVCHCELSAHRETWRLFAAEGDTSPIAVVIATGIVIFTAGCCDSIVNVMCVDACCGKEHKARAGRGDPGGKDKKDKKDSFLSVLPQ